MKERKTETAAGRRLGRSLRLGALMLAMLLVLPTVGACRLSNGGGGLDGFELTVADHRQWRWKYQPDSPNAYEKVWNKMLTEVKKEYNVTITPLTVVEADMANKAKTSVLAGTKYADLVITAQWVSGYMIASDIMANLCDLAEYGVDIKTADWVNKQQLEVVTLKNDTVYFINMSFCSDMPQMWVLYVNFDMLKEIAPGVDLYEVVNNKEWTVDLFRELCKKALKDQDSDGVVSTVEDRWGVLTPQGDFNRSFFLGLGGHYYRKNAETGRMEPAYNNDYTYARVDKMLSVGRYGDNSIMPLEEYKRAIDQWPLWLNERALFMAFMNGQPEPKQANFSWGVIPMPMFDTNQERYMSAVDHNASVVGITNTNENLTEVATLLKAFGEKGMELEDIYWPDYELTYWQPGKEDINQAILEEHVKGHGAYDVMLFMRNAFEDLHWPMDTVSPNFASDAERYMPLVQAALEEAFNGE